MRLPRASLLALLFVMFSAVAGAMPLPFPCPPDSTSGDSLYFTERELFRCHLNMDCRIDTIFGLPGANGSHLPTRISWGGADSSLYVPCPGDTGMLLPKYRHTFFEYSLLDSIEGSAAVTRVDSDTLDDVVLFYWWRVGDSTSRRDTARAVALFSGRMWDTVAVISVASLGPSQVMPFPARELNPGGELAQPEVRDLSDIESFFLETVQRPGPPPPPRTDVASVPLVAELRVFPNPTAYATSVTSTTVPPGTYDLLVIDVTGAIRERKPITIPESQELASTIDLRRLPIGYYIIRLSRDGAPALSYPVIVNR